MSPKKGSKRTGADPGLAARSGRKRVGRNPDAPANAGTKRIFQPPTLAESQRITWLFGALDLAGPFDRPASLPELGTIHDVICGVEKRTVQEVFDSATGGNRQTVGAGKRIPVDNINKAARARLIELEFDDHDELWELRITKTARLWCLRQRHLFSVLWWDPNHQVCG